MTRSQLKRVGFNGFLEANEPVLIVPDYDRTADAHGGGEGSEGGGGAGGRGEGGRGGGELNDEWSPTALSARFGDTEVNTLIYDQSVDQAQNFFTAQVPRRQG